jgi:hypothetical protein
MLTATVASKRKQHNRMYYMKKMRDLPSSPAVTTMTTTTTMMTTMTVTTTMATTAAMRAIAATPILADPWSFTTKDTIQKSAAKRMAESHLLRWPSTTFAKPEMPQCSQLF